jgi:hypothetical protein
MYDSTLEKTLEALIPSLYFVPGAVAFIRDEPPPAAIAIGTTGAIQDAINAGIELPATQIAVYTFADEHTAHAFDAGITTADNALRGCLHVDTRTGLTFLALYDPDNPNVDVIHRDYRHLSPFSPQDLATRVLIVEGTQQRETSVQEMLDNNKKTPDLSNALRSIAGGLTHEVLVDFGAGGRITLRAVQPRLLETITQPATSEARAPEDTAFLATIAEDVRDAARRMEDNGFYTRSAVLYAAADAILQPQPSKGNISWAVEPADAI